MTGSAGGTRRVPMWCAAGAENWGLGVVSPIKIMILGLFKKADVPIGFKAYVRGGNLVSEFQSEAGKVFDLGDLDKSLENARSGTLPADHLTPPCLPLDTGTTRRLQTQAPQGKRDVYL